MEYIWIDAIDFSDYGGEWVKVADVKDNIQRLVVLKFDSIKTTEIKLTVLSAFDSNRAVVPEIGIL